jgi:hypothetical protein
VKKLIVFGAGTAVVAAASAAALFGAGVAGAAPDVVGMQYADAVSEIESEGGTPVIASRFGSHPNVDECLVTDAWDASFLRIDEAAEDQVMVTLNCNGGYATAHNPGPSAASPEAKASKAAEEEQAAQEQAEQQEEEELAAPVTPDE